MITSNKREVRFPQIEKAIALNVGQSFTYECGARCSYLTYAGMNNEKSFSINILNEESTDHSRDINVQLYFPCSIDKITVFDSSGKPHLFKQHDVNPERIVLEELFEKESKSI